MKLQKSYFIFTAERLNISWSFYKRTDHSSESNNKYLNTLNINGTELWSISGADWSQNWTTGRNEENKETVWDERVGAGSGRVAAL